MIDPSLFTLPYDLALSRALRAQGCDVTLHGRRLRALEDVSPDDGIEAPFYALSERIKGHVPGKIFHLVKGLEHAVDITRLARKFRRIPPSVVHFQWSALPAVDLAAVRYIRLSLAPAILTVHDVKPFNDAPTSMLQRLGSLSIWREFDHLITHSETSRAILCQHGIHAERISVIPHGVLDTAATTAPTLPDAAPVTILLFGRIKPYKGIDLMIEALGRIPPQLRTHCRVLIVGEPMMAVDTLQQRAAALGVAGNIVWDLRYVSDGDMAAVFRQADIFAFPYREIDTSGVLMSCLPYGKPIIASAVGAFPKILEDGVHGRIVPPEDPAALADAVTALLTDPALRATYGHNVTTLSARIPSWDVIAKQTMAVYERLIRARGGAAHRHGLRQLTA